MKKAVWLLVILLVGFFSIRVWWISQLSAASSDRSTKIFVIEKGQNFPDISKKLKNENLIKSVWAFSILAKQKYLANKIQAGTFRLSQSMSSEEILKTLTENPLDNWVTLLEGWRVEEMADEINSKVQIPMREFLAVAKEGYMFPDTYLFPKEYSADQIAKVMRDNFEKKYTPELRAKIKSFGLTEKQGVILASIVEREARSDEARKMVASILLKRFKIGMGLNADATIQYALGYQKDENPPAGGWWKRQLTRDDLKINSPYNTYIHSGLPPTPIANPSLASLKVVADADPSTPYLYYYHDSKGNSHYAKNLEEHNINIANNP